MAGSRTDNKGTYMALNRQIRYRAVAVLSWLLLAAGCAASVWFAWPRSHDATLANELPSLTSLSHEVDDGLLETDAALRNIEEIQIGDRVLAWNPELTEEEHAVADPVADDWNRIDLAIVKSDGYRLDISLLRPRAWIAEQQAEVGKSIHLDLPELNQYGDAQVLAIGPCPDIKPGPGRVVIGTFRHTSGDTIDVRVKDLDDPIGATQDHPFWSEDRQAFVDARELRVGEHVKTHSGQITEIESITSRGPPEPVYNLEIHAENVYYVSDIGVLVHNSTPYSSRTGTKSGPDFIVTPSGVAVSRKTLSMQGRSPLAGNFQGLAGKSVDEIVSRVPATWKMVPQDRGMGIKFLDDAGFERIRLHAASARAPQGSNSASGWTLRIMDRAGNYYDDVGKIVPYRANEGHIPIFGNPNAP